MVQSVKKALNILSILGDSKNEPVTLKSISEVTGFSKPTCAHILETLCDEGYAVNVSRFGGYILGPSAFCLTRYGRYCEDMISVSSPILRWMAKKTDTHAVFAVIESNRKYVIEYQDNDRNTHNNNTRISTDDIYRTATGRAILANMDRKSVIDIYKKYGAPSKDDWEAVTSYESLIEELEKLKKQKIIISGFENGRYTYSHIGFARPIFKKRKCVGAVGLAYSTKGYTRLLDEKIESLICSVLLRGSAEIERRISYE